VDSYKEAAPFLRRPFTPEAVRFKVQATWDGGALVVAYIDARLVFERLNMVCPHLWADAYEPTPSGLMWCHLTIDGITRRDVGEGEKKGLVSDALKRAAVHFGIGVSLYAIPKMRVYVNNQHLEVDGRDKYKLTPKGEAHCRSIYAGWLDSVGRNAFGEPLDHGDSAEAIGDMDDQGAQVSAGVQPPASSNAEERPRDTIPAARAAAIEASILALNLNSQRVGIILNTCGISGLRAASVKALKERLASLDAEEADRFETELLRLRQDAEAEAPQAAPAEGPDA
jgi:hypothetical protein